MASKIIKINIDNVETEIVIRRIKKKELKTLIAVVAAKAEEWIKFLDASNLLSILEGLATENIDFICNQMVLPFTSLTNFQLDEMDMVDIFSLSKELLSYNKVDVEKVVNFLKPDPAMLKKTAEILNFGGLSIPSQN